MTHPHRPRRCLQRGRRNDAMAAADVGVVAGASGGGGSNHSVGNLGNGDNVKRNTRDASSSSVGSPVIPVPRPRAASSKTPGTMPQWGHKAAAANGAENTKLRRQSTWAYSRGNASGPAVWSSASFKESFKKRCQFLL